MIKWGFIPSIWVWFIIQRSICVFHHVNRLKKKTWYLFIIKKFDKIEHLFITKSLDKLAIKKNFLNLIVSTKIYGIGSSSRLQCRKDPELTSSPRHTKSTAMCETISSEKKRNLAEQLLHTGQTRKKPTSKWVEEAETQSCHKLDLWQGDPQSGGNTKS